MAGPFQTKLFGLAAKVESTYGSDASPTFTTNAIRLESPPDGPGEDYLFPNEREDAATGTIGRLAAAAPGGRFHSWTYEVVGLGAGSAYSSSNLPNIDPLLQTLFSQTVDTTSGSEKVTYSLLDAPATGVTLYTELANKKYVTRGAIPESLVIRSDAGGFPIWEFQMVGIADVPSEQALETATYSTVNPPIMENSSTTFDPGTDGGSSYTPVIRSWELDLGIEVADRADGNAANPHLGYRVVGRDPRFTVTVEVDSLTNFDPTDLWTNITQVAIDSTIGTTQYGRFDLDFDDARVQDYDHVDDDGLQVYEVEFALFQNSGAELDLIFD